jgi:hypothetical protein
LVVNPLFTALPQPARHLIPLNLSEPRSQKNADYYDQLAEEIAALLFCYHAF